MNNQREFKAKIVARFKAKWLQCVVEEENISMAEAVDYYGGKDLDSLDKRISCKVVIMVENKYQLGATDYFEKKDNNFVIFPELFREV